MRFRSCPPCFSSTKGTKESPTSRDMSSILIRLSIGSCPAALGAAATRVDAGHQDTRQGVVISEKSRAGHGAVELGVPGDRPATLPGLLLINVAGIQAGVDSHLLTGQGVEGETSCYFRRADRAVADH